MSPRNAVLAALRARALERVPLPALPSGGSRYPDPVEQFCRALAQAAGSSVLVDAAGAGAAVERLEVFRRATRRCSLAPAVAGSVPLPGEPAAFRDVELLIVPAELGVAENGAVWIDEESVPVRAGLFLAQHLVVLLARAHIAHDLHEAYARLGERVGRKGYGCWMCGPSKTADIEQALVVGAHGPRSLTVVLH